MGAWGPGLYSDDFAEDLRGEFKELFQGGTAPDAIAAALKRSNHSSLSDIDEAPVFWLVLADLLHKHGIEDIEVTSRAIETIDSGTDLERWSEDPKLMRKREANLLKLKNQLLSPLPSLKKPKKPFTIDIDWKVGEYIAYTLNDGTKCVFLVTYKYVQHDFTAWYCKVLKFNNTKIPNRVQLEIKPHWTAFDGGVFKVMLIAQSHKEYEPSRFEKVGKSPRVRVPQADRVGESSFATRFKDLDETLQKRFGYGHRSTPRVE